MTDEDFLEAVERMADQIKSLAQSIAILANGVGAINRTIADLNIVVARQGDRLILLEAARAVEEQDERRTVN